MSDKKSQFFENSSDDLAGKIVEANALESSGETDKAISIYQKIATLDPDGNYGNVAREALASLQKKQSQSGTEKTVEDLKASGLWNRLNLRNKTTLILIGISAFSTLFVSSIAFNFASRALTKQITLNQQGSASQVVNKIAFYMRERFGDIQIMSSLNILTDPELRRTTSAQEKQTALDSFVKAYKIYNSIAAFDLNGNVLAQTSGKTLGNHKDRSYFQAALKEDKPILSQPSLSTSTGIMAVYLASPIKEGRTGKTIGVLRARMPVKHLRDLIISDLSHSNYLLDNQGKVFTASDSTENSAINKSPDKAIAASKQFNFFGKLQSLSNNNIESSGDTSVKANNAISSLLTDDNLVSYVPFSEVNSGFLTELPNLGWSVISSVDKKEIFSVRKQLIISFLVGTLIIVILVTVIASIIGYRVTQPVLETAKTIKKLGAGKFEERIAITSKDELGDLSYDINKMAEKIQQLLDVQEQEVKNQKQQKETLQQGVMSLLLDVEGAQKGDLTVRAQMTDGAVGSIADAFNSTISKLQELLQQVQSVSNDVGQLSLAGEGSVRQLSESALSQAAEISDARNSIDEINQSVETIADYAQEAAQIARNGSIQAREGGLAMDATVDSIETIRNTVATTSKKVKQLAESSQEIAQIVEIISGISEKTNLLAFNASVEAARAGEHGEGFRIVAEEVRRLADRITGSTKDIQQLVSTIQQNTTSVLEGMETSTTEVVNGSELIHMTKLNLQTLAKTSQEIDEFLKSISTNTIKQTDNSRQINEKINGIALVAETNSTEAQSVLVSLQTLVGEAETLQSSVSKFRLQA